MFSCLHVGWILLISDDHIHVELCDKLFNTTNTYVSLTKYLYYVVDIQDQTVSDHKVFNDSFTLQFQLNQVEERIFKLPMYGLYCGSFETSTDINDSIGNSWLNATH